MKKSEIEIKHTILDKALTELSTLKDDSKLATMFLISKGNTVISEDEVLKSFDKLLEEFNILIDNTIDFISTAKLEFLELDEKYANIVK